MSHHEDKLRLLLVDDEEEFLDATARALGRRGFEVEKAPDAEVALRLVQLARFDVAVIDVKMPGMDGMELARRLRARWPALPIVMLTGHGTPEQAFQSTREGTVDFLTKPCEVETLAERIRAAVQRAATLSAEQDAAAGEQETIRVLVVDDDVDLLDSLARVLGRRRMTVTKASSGAEALRLLEQEPRDVVVLDVKMPGMDGLETLERIKQTGGGPQVLLLTGHPSAHNAFEGVRAGAFDYLLKPHSVDELVRMIRAAFRHGRLLEEERRHKHADGLREDDSD